MHGRTKVSHTPSRPGLSFTHKKLHVVTQVCNLSTWEAEDQVSLCVCGFFFSFPLSETGSLTVQLQLTWNLLCRLAKLASNRDGPATDSQVVGLKHRHTQHGFESSLG